MQDWVVALIAIFCAIFCLLIVLICLLIILRTRKKATPPSSNATPRHSESPAPMPDVYPHIPRPISTISLRSSASEHRPNVFDTFSAAKLSQLFDGRKSSLPSRINYFDFQSSPQLGHKEYLDFSEIENILISKCDRPKKETTLTDSYRPIDTTGTRTGTGTVQKVYSEDEITYNRALSPA
ncbi:hypothetical protein WR25_00365 [Diploscapter pachys]|uniref:Uncharacterized protein n=1 Tax=Diploscapter pachys TaxID=2018661 RepID=A0A2A2JYK3_9BILA|nr:hypothetical protein WR25_00365 [Diploscapter pachys]